jgi:hypothetical protein
LAGEEKCIQVLMRKLKERDFLEDLGVDRSIILKWILHKNGLHSSGCGYGQAAGCSEHYCDPGFAKCMTFLSG